MNSAVLTPESRPIGRSWDRSRMCGLDEGIIPELPFREGVELQSSFARAAAPVLDRLGQMLGATEMSAVLLDSSGCFLTSRCEDARLRDRMDRGQSAPGFVWLEEYAGTSAVGIALEDRVPAWTTGADHYLEMLRDLTCAAAPIINPFTQRLEGAIDITALRPHSSPLMLPIVLQAAQAIEEALLEIGSPSERALLDQFLRAKRRPGSIVLALGDRTEVSTSNATRLTDADRLYLSQRADDLPAFGSVSDRIVLAGGQAASVRLEVVEVGGRRAGTIVELVIDQDSGRRPRRVPRPDRATDFDSGLVGHSQATRFLQTRLEQLADSTFPLVISGESGVGKLALAKAIAREDYVLVDATRSSADTEDSLLREVAGVVGGAHRTVIVREIDALSIEGTQRLASIAEAAEKNHSRVLCTVTERDAAEPTRRPTFGVRIRIPALRERPEDIIDLVPALLARRGLSHRVNDAVMKALLRNDWPGNIRELDGVLAGMAESRPRGEVTLADLPAFYQRGARRLRRIEHVERNAIVQALLESNGNKTQAAELLEIGRATLYRKMRVYGLDNDLSLAG